MPGDQHPARRDKPDIGRRRLGDNAMGIDEPSVTRAALERRLPGQHVRQKSDCLDVDAAPAVIRDRYHRYSPLGERFIACFVECACRDHKAWPYFVRRKSMITPRDAARNLQIDNAVADAVASDHFAYDNAERARGHRHADVQFAKRALKPFQVPPPVDQLAAPHLAYFINAIAELIAAILDVNFGLGERQVTAIDISDAGHVW